MGQYQGQNYKSVIPSKKLVDEYSGVNSKQDKDYRKTPKGGRDTNHHWTDVMGWESASRVGRIGGGFKRY